MTVLRRAQVEVDPARKGGVAPPLHPPNVVGVRVFVGWLYVRGYAAGSAEAAYCYGFSVVAPDKCALT